MEHSRIKKFLLKIKNIVSVKYLIQAGTVKKIYIFSSKKVYVFVL